MYQTNWVEAIYDKSENETGKILNLGIVMLCMSHWASFTSICIETT